MSRPVVKTVVHDRTTLPPKAVEEVLQHARPGSPSATKLQRLMDMIYWGGLFLTLAVALAIHVAGDRVWWGTMLLFGPRWIWGIPLFFVLVAAWGRGRIRQGLALLALGCFGFWILGFNVPLASIGGSKNDTLRLMTLNLGTTPVRWSEFFRLISEERLDVVVLQECRSLPENSWPADWHIIQAGELVIASRYPMTESEVIQRALSHRYPRAIALIGEIDSPAGKFPLATLHMLSPSQGLQQMLSARTVIQWEARGIVEQESLWRWAENEHASRQLARFSDELIIAGDFNTPIESPIYRTAWGHYGNAFSQAGLGCGATAFQTRRNFQFSSRIDHVLFGPRWRCRAARVGPDLGSDHRPVIVDLQHLPGER